MNGSQPTQTETASHSHRTELATLVFTDLVGSTALKQQWGDKAGAALIQQHHALVREVRQEFADSQEIETAGDSFLLLFTRPSDAVRFALRLQARLRRPLAAGAGAAVVVQDRIGIHLGEIVIAEHQQGLKPRDLYGLQVDTCGRVMSLAQGGQVLMTRPERCQVLLSATSACPPAADTAGCSGRPRCPFAAAR
jgi:class 3 adenylate cyclase